jgi:hypothetical protein
VADLNALLAWDADGLWIGALRGRDLDLQPVPRTVGWRDIRNCSAPTDAAWAAVSGVDPQTGTHVIRRVDLVSGDARLLVEASYLAYCAVDPTGRRLAYTGSPCGGRSALSLHVADLSEGTSRLFAEGIVNGSSPPGWRSTNRILLDIESSGVTELDADAASLVRLFPGHQPTSSPDGSRIAYRDGAALRLFSADGTHQDISPGRRPIRYRGPITWSRDGRLLLLAQAAGTLGYGLRFGCLDVATRELTRVRGPRMLGVVFR